MKNSEHTILITGATGFLGSYLLKKFIDSKYNIIILKRSTSNTNRINTYLKDIKTYDVDLINPESIFQNNKIDTIIHCATNYGRKEINPFNTISANLLLPVELLVQGIKAGVKNFINTDTILNKRISHYSLSKKHFYDWLMMYSKEINCINISIEHFYGPNDDKTKFASWIVNQLINNAPQIDLTLGVQKRDFIYIDDVVEAFYTILKNINTIPKGFKHFEVASGQSISIKDFVELVKKKTQNTSTKLNFGAIPYRNEEIMEYNVDISELKELGWLPQIDLHKGISKLIELEKK